MEKEDIRTEFLKSFIKAAIMHSYDPSKQPKIEPKEEQAIIKALDEYKIQEKPKEKLEKKIMPAKRIKLPILPSPSKYPQYKTPPQKILSSLQAPQQNTTPVPIQIISPPPVVNVPTIREPVNFGKINQILRDPAVFSVECPGPEKSVIVNRSGLVQNSPIQLTKEEIDMIMEEISDKTRIPITPGLFKVAVMDLLVTAIISEYAGNRFVIQKINPLMRRF